MTLLNSIINKSLDTLLKYQGTSVYNLRTALTFIAILNPVYEQETFAGARIKKRTYCLICRNSDDIVEGDSLAINGRAFSVLPREAQSGALSLDEVSKKVRIVEK